MSSREHLYKIAEEAISSYKTWLDDDTPGISTHPTLAATVVQALLPQIFSQKQMVGVPEGSILIVEIQGGARALRWEDGFLHGNLSADQMPMKPDWVIDRYGPLTVVWTP